MKLIVLARATQEAAKTEFEEHRRFADLKAGIEARKARIEVAWALLGRYDYLLVLDVPDEAHAAFATLSQIAQSGTMTTETFLAIPLETYFRLAAEVRAPSTSTRR